MSKMYGNKLEIKEIWKQIKKAQVLVKNEMKINPKAFAISFLTALC